MSFLRPRKSGITSSEQTSRRESWNYGIKVGFSDRTHVMATLNYRF
ncbi:MAG: hypothetical protein Ct9H300mP7_7240 [Verrucomicrobiota bacterium]|nr:MAG: hypothetical protein Ct9H300mP7_7240 [Verrucomicrobiota bacterium]